MTVRRLIRLASRIPAAQRLMGVALAAALLCLPAAAPAQSPSKLDIALADGLLTMSVSDAPLEQVLQTIADKAAFTLDITGQLESTVSASFEKLPLERALRRLVGRSSYVIELAPPDGADGKRRIARLSVIAREAPRRAAPPRSKRTKRATTNKKKPTRPTTTRRPPRSPSS